MINGHLLRRDRYLGNPVVRVAHTGYCLRYGSIWQKAPLNGPPNII